MFGFTRCVLPIVIFVQLSGSESQNFPEQTERLSISARFEQCSDDTPNLFDLSKLHISTDLFNTFTVGGDIKLLKEIKAPAKFTYNTTACTKDDSHNLVCEPFHPFVLRTFCETQSFHILGLFESVVPRIMSCPIEPGIYTIPNTTIDMTKHMGHTLVEDWHTRFLMELPTITACVEAVYECQPDSN